MTESSERALNRATFGMALYAAERVADAKSEAREKVAALMLRNSIATGHGDTIDDLLAELDAFLKSRLAGPATT